MCVVCCCGGIDNCDSSGWPAFLYLTSGGNTATLADLGGFWQGYLKVDGAPGYDGLCSSFTYSYVQVNVLCSGTALIVTYTQFYRFCAGAWQTYASAATTSTRCFTGASTITTFNNSGPYAMGTFDNTPSSCFPIGTYPTPCTNATWSLSP